MIEISAHEPLLAALGGAPIGLKHHLEAELDRWTENNIKPLFVFEGQSTVGKDDIALRNAKEALDRTENAWKLYINGEPDKAVTAFGNSRMQSSTGTKEDADIIQMPFELKTCTPSYKKFWTSAV
jgi:hypothetical protein